MSDRCINYVSLTPITIIPGGSQSATTTIIPTEVAAYNLLQIIGVPKISPIVNEINFSFLTRTANYDLVLTPGMTMAQIQSEITSTGVTIVDGYITIEPAMRPLVVVGFTKDLGILGPLLGLESPENCVSGNSFSYPINGLVFPLPMASNMDVPLLSVNLSNSTEPGTPVIMNTTPLTTDINNRYVTSVTPVTTITVSFVSVYGTPGLLTSDVIVVLKLN